MATRARKLMLKKREIGALLEGIARKGLSRLCKKMDEDKNFSLSPKDAALLAELSARLQEAQYPEVVDKQTGRRGIEALAESIKLLADKTIERYERA